MKIIRVPLFPDSARERFIPIVLSALVASVLFFGSAAYAKIYVSTDSDRRIQITDYPTANSEEVVSARPMHTQSGDTIETTTIAREQEPPAIPPKQSFDAHEKSDNSANDGMIIFYLIVISIVALLSNLTWTKSKLAALRPYLLSGMAITTYWVVPLGIGISIVIDSFHRGQFEPAQFVLGLAISIPVAIVLIRRAIKHIR